MSMLMISELEIKRLVLKLLRSQFCLNARKNFAKKLKVLLSQKVIIRNHCLTTEKQIKRKLCKAQKTKNARRSNVQHAF